jgi:hypothetical protein
VRDEVSYQAPKLDYSELAGRRDASRAADHAVAPDDLQEVVLAVDAGQVACEMREQRELLAAKRDGHAYERGGACRRVDLKRDAHDDRRTVDEAVAVQ